MKKMFMLALLAACGDSTHGHPTPDGGVDAGGDAAIDAPPAPTRAVVVAGDFSPGSPGVLSVLDLATRTVMANVGPAGAIGEDPVLRKHNGELLVVNRASGNNVTVLDANDFSLVEQLGTGAGTNPQDVAVIGNKVFVATLGNKGAVVLTRGSTTVTEIDLSVDDPDGKPNCSSIYVVGGDLYVACGLLDDTQTYLPPRGPGKVYVVDPNSLAITRTITLANKNPFGALERIPVGAPNEGDLVIPTIDWATSEGCIERVTTGPNAASAGCVVTNADLGGGGAYVVRAEINAQDATMFAAVSKYPDAKLRGYDLTAGTLWADPVSPAAQTIVDVAVCPTGDVVVSDSTMDAAGLRVYRGTVEQTTAALPVGLRPQSSHGLLCY